MIRNRAKPRFSPSCPAKDRKNEISLGNDGKLWLSKLCGPSYRWVRCKNRKAKKIVGQHIHMHAYNFIQRVWERGVPISSLDPRLYRMDIFRNIVRRDAYGRLTVFGWKLKYTQHKRDGNIAVDVIPIHIREE
jgi:hypothetical protein